MADLKRRLALLEARRRQRRGEWFVAVAGETPEEDIAAAIARGTHVVLVQYVDRPPAAGVDPVPTDTGSAT